MTGFTTVVRHAIYDRDCGQCVRCGELVLVWDDVRWLALAEYSIQHRRPRGMGGSSDPATNAPTNGVLLCGSATTPGGCHLWAESNRTEAYEAGFLVHQGIDPATIPVQHHSLGLVYITPAGYEVRANA